jgi:hypothetical protein
MDVPWSKSSTNMHTTVQNRSIRTLSNLSSSSCDQLLIQIISSGRMNRSRDACGTCSDDSPSTWERLRSAR